MARITMDDIAEKLGVSRALVSLAYRNLPGVGDETRERILRAGEELGYTPNQMAARLASRGGDTVGVFLQDLHNDLFADFHDGIREAVRAAGKQLVLAVGSRDGEYDGAALEALRRSRVDVLIAGGLLLPDAEVRRLAEAVPTVCAFRLVENVDSVAADDLGGARAATEHLIALGHSRIAFLANPPSDGYLDRREGYRAAMASAGLESCVIESSYDRAVVAEDAGRLLDAADAPTAIFAHNDQAAYGVLDALTIRDLAAGQDVSVVGFDNSSVGRFPGTALTSVDVDSGRLGRIAAELALARIAAPGEPAVHRVLSPSLVARTTSGPVHA